MGTIVASVIFVAACVSAPAYQGLLLPESRHIVGVVVDEEGKPVAEAFVDHTNDRQQVHKTDAEGRFELDTRAPAIVIRKAGFQSGFVRTQNAGQIRITLRKIPHGRSFPLCRSDAGYVGITGWDASFQFSKRSRFKASKQGRDH